VTAPANSAISRTLGTLETRMATRARRGCDHAPTCPIELSTTEDLDNIRRRHLLVIEQHAKIGAWWPNAKSPEAIMAMPPHL
jgi:hypothetical protein